MSTTAEKLTLLLNTKAAIKAALVEKGQEVGNVFSTYPDKIRAIEIGVDTSDANAKASDILSGKTAYVDGVKVTGNIPSKTEKDLSANGATVSVPAGYYSNSTNKSVATASQATPYITVSGVGKITATVEQSEGYVTGGTETAELFMETTTGGTITPTTERQKVALAGTYNPSDISVLGDADLVASNIVKGKNIFGVNGTAGITATHDGAGNVTIVMTGVSGISVG